MLESEHALLVLHKICGLDPTEIQEQLELELLRLSEPPGQDTEKSVTIMGLFPQIGRLSPLTKLNDCSLVI